MPTILHVAMARIRAFLRPGNLDSDFDEELESHLAMAEEDKIREGMSPDQARRAARLELGGVTQLREASHEARGLPWLEAYWLDVKLGLRMLRKSWGLTLIGGLAMTIVIGTSLIVFAIVELQFRPTLPLDEGSRVIALQTWDATEHRRHRTSFRDLDVWRDSLRSVEDVGAFQTLERTLVIGEGTAEPALGNGSAPSIAIAEIAASGFRLARIAPLMGRPLVDEDEFPGAAPVVVIGYDVWQSRFSADPAVVGRLVRLGNLVHTVVGVMPEHFAFPVNHKFWVPLRRDWMTDLAGGAGQSDLLGDEEGSGVVFGRLTPGATLEDAQDELSTLGLLATQEPDQELQPRIVNYTFAFTGDFEPGQIRWAIRLVLLLGAFLLIPPCANIAILVYARTVTRQGEFATRYALGASRRRIVAQLFVEMLVLTAAAAGLALLLASLALRWAEVTLQDAMTDGPPFWMDFSLSFPTILLAAALAVVAALIAALVPALKATGKQMQSGLRALGSRAGLQLGGTWTALVVTQVALTLATLPSAVEIGWGTIRQGVLGPGFAAGEYLTAQVGVDREAVAGSADGMDRETFASHFGALQTELVRRLSAESGVFGVTVAEAVPGGGRWVHIEVDGVARPEQGIVSASSLVRSNRVDETFFDTLGIQFLTGRGFGPSDREPGAAAVIVNRTFASQLLGDHNPLGRHVRYIQPRTNGAAAPDSESPPWYEIVGVVEDRPANASAGTMYHPMTAGQLHPASLIVRLGSTAADKGQRLREIATALDPTIKVDEIATLGEIYRGKQVGNNMGALSLAIVTLSVLLLSAAGMYALLSFTVNQRRREIGIRSALGAPPTHILTGIFRRAAGQVGTGAALGVLAALLLDYFLPSETVGGWSLPGVIPGAAALMIVIGLVAAAGPARRALRVAPIDALREG